MKAALEGIKILDLSRLLPFEYGTLLLADLGAEVLKVEEPGRGDYMRKIPPLLKEEGAIFLLLDRNKKSLTLNLRAREGKEILLQLVRQADVLFESFRPGTLDRLGLGYSQLQEVNPRLIYCSSTGYGQEGPYQDRPGHDSNYLSIAGILGVLSGKGRPPLIPGLPIADMTAGLFSAFAILVGLLARQQTGRGQHIDVPMTDCMLSFNSPNVAHHLALLQDPQRSMTEGTMSWGQEVPWRNVYETQDGRYLCFANLEEKFWANLCTAIGRPDLAGQHDTPQERSHQITEELRLLFRSKTLAEWCGIVEGIDTCFSPVHTMEEVLRDPHLTARQMFTEVDHPVEGKLLQVSFPLKLSETPAQVQSPAPLLGEHTAEVLKRLGYGEEAIQRLRDQGVV
ncbi:MAG: CoA transferase [Candidatus Tectomicrobia bacterium]|uniref:CoA transferase n=1 Tax=Tectimicrobiota bacterium TaxID=2528274 RepID=A0A932CNZ7_UNCTE|nr:CoA transferase [Candidatus Tectomicrobia bacterium]